MALSRLRHPVISRASSLLRAGSALSAYHDSAGSLTRFSGGPYSLVDGNGFLFRPASLPGVTEVHENATKLAWRIRVQHFSSAELPPHMVVGMPALSPTMTQGNIAKWRKKEGDKIEVGDILCEIETDKATLEFESLEEGFLAKILAPEGSKNVPVGQPIAITVEDADDINNVPSNVGSGVESTNSDAKNEGRGKETSSAINTSEAPPHIVIQMPALSPTMEQGYITHWRVKEGDKVEMGDVLCEIETDKATIEFECLEEGYVAKILVPEGFKDVAVGQPIVVIVEDPDNIETVKKSVTGGMQIKEEKSTHHDSKDESTEQKTSFRRISPAAKLLISEHVLDSSSLKASGPHGTLLKSDVLAAIKSAKLSSEKSSPEETRSPSPQGGQQPSTVAFQKSKSHLQQLDSFEDLPNTQIRKVIAKRLLESKHTIPHLYLSTDVVLDPLLSFRKELKDKHDIKVSVNDIVIKAVAIALRNVPEANAYWNAKKGEIILCDSVDISIAVATEKGLLTPIVRNADQKSITAISSEVKQLAEKARAGKLAPNEYQGGTFSISNLGMYPVDHFAAIINPPQAGILAVGRGNKVVVPLVGSDGIERPVAVNKMSLSLSADHRVFDGKVGGTFLSALRSNFSDIQRLLLL